jgi:plasmid maintenance system killer protein
MHILYKTKKLEKSLSSPKEIERYYGQRAKLINQRLIELRDASTLGVLRNIPAAKCHELSGKRKGQFAVMISGNWRIVFEPRQPPPPLKKDGGIDWHSITIIEIQEITDYH